MTYLVLKLIHIVSATLLFGTGLGSAFYFFLAHLSGNVTNMRITSKHVIIADWIFTTPAVIIQLVTGVMMVFTVGSSWSSPWIWLSLVLYILAGICWLPVVWLQIQIHRFCVTAEDTQAPLPKHYHQYVKAWFILGWPAFTAVMVIIYLMVFKPTQFG